MIKAIIFDYGGVIGLDPRNSIYNIVGEKIKIKPAIIKQKFSAYSELLQTGSVSEKYFWKKMSDDLGFDDSKSLRNIWTSAFISKTKVNQDVLALVKKLKSRYRLCLLSNSISFYTDSSPITPTLNALFDCVVYSYKVKTRKPDKRIYKFALKKLQLNSDECLIVDDRERNLVIPKKVGMSTILFKDYFQLKDSLSDLSLLK